MSLWKKNMEPAKDFMPLRFEFQLRLGTELAAEYEVWVGRNGELSYRWRPVGTIEYSWIDCDRAFIDKMVSNCAERNKQLVGEKS